MYLSKESQAKPGNAYKKEHPNMTTMSYIESNCKVNKKNQFVVNSIMVWRLLRKIVICIFKKFP